MSKKYEGIIVYAYWFSEGEFWCVGANGYIANYDFPSYIETDPNTFSEGKDEVDEVVRQLQDIATLFDSEADIVTVHVNGSEVSERQVSYDRPIVCKEVQLGIELLDQKVPGWFNKIDLKTFDMLNPCLCVIGQVFQVVKDNANTYDNYSNNLKAILKIDAVLDEDIRLGFDCPNEIFAEDYDGPDWQDLQHDWIAYIAYAQAINRNKKL